MTRLVRAPILDVAHHASLSAAERERAARDFFTSEAAPFNYLSLIGFSREYLRDGNAQAIFTKISEIDYSTKRAAYEGAFGSFVENFPLGKLSPMSVPKKTLELGRDLGILVQPTCYLKENGEVALVVQQPRATYSGGGKAFEIIATAVYLRYVVLGEVPASKVIVCDARRGYGGGRIALRREFRERDMLSKAEFDSILDAYAETIENLIAAGVNVAFRRQPGPAPGLFDF